MAQPSPKLPRIVTKTPAPLSKKPETGETTPSERQKPKLPSSKPDKLKTSYDSDTLGSPSGTFSGKGSLSEAIERMEKKETLAQRLISRRNLHNPLTVGKSEGDLQDEGASPRRLNPLDNEPRQHSEHCDSGILTQMEKYNSPINSLLQRIEKKTSNSLTSSQLSSGSTSACSSPKEKRPSKINTSNESFKSKRRSSMLSASATMSYKEDIAYYISKDYKKDPLWQLMGKENNINEDQVSESSSVEYAEGKHTRLASAKPGRMNSVIAHKEPTLSSRITENWSRLYHFTLLAKRLLKAYQKHEEKAILFIKETPAKDLTVSFINNRMEFQPDAFAVDKVKQLLQIPPSERNEEELIRLRRALTGLIPDFAKFALEERLSFCKLMTLETYPPGKLLFTANHTPSCFYFILSGQVEIFKLNNGVRDCLNNVGAGKILGHRIFDSSNAKRTASVATTMITNLLYINKDNYIQTMAKNKEKTSALILERLQHTSIFEYHIDFLQKILPYFKVYNFSRNQPIQEEGRQPMEFYFILDGKCRVVQSVPLNKHNRKGKEISNELTVSVETLQLLVGDSFPPIPNLHPDGSLKYLGSSVIDPKVYYEFYTNLKMTDPRTFCKAGLECVFEVSIAAIPLTDFFRHAPKEVIFTLVMEPRVKIFTPEEVQEQYDLVSKWKGYRKSVIAEYHD